MQVCGAGLQCGFKQFIKRPHHRRAAGQITQQFDVCAGCLAGGRVCCYTIDLFAERQSNVIRCGQQTERRAPQCQLCRLDAGHVPRVGGGHCGMIVQQKRINTGFTQKPH